MNNESEEQLSIISQEELVERALHANQDIENDCLHTIEEVMNEDWD